MEISSVTYLGWRDGHQIVEKRVTYDYEKGNDVTVVETRRYQIILYDSMGQPQQHGKGNNIDQMV